MDGTGNPGFRADVAIKDGRVARVGRVEPSQARRVIDAHGQIVAPGFIDVHTHVEGIYAQPAAENFVRMGVTTLVTGNCGTSATNVAEFLDRSKQPPIAVNLAPDPAQRSTLDRLFNYYMQDPDVASGWRDAVSR